MLESIISGTVTMPEALVLTCTSTVQCLPFQTFCSGITVWLLLGQSIAWAMPNKAAAKSSITDDMTASCCAAAKGGREKVDLISRREWRGQWGEESQGQRG